MMSRTNDLKHQTVLITGASGGIGAAIARRFAEQQANIVLHYHQSHDEILTIEQECLNLGSKTVVISADFHKTIELHHLKEKLDSLHIFPDILINNAGVSHYGMISEVTEEAWDYVMNVNLKATFFCTQLFIPYMITQKFGKIINISSIWGLTGASCEVLYSTSKGGLHAFTKALAKELAPSNITVNTVAPGAVDTSMMDMFSFEEKQQLTSSIPLGRLAHPDDIASLVFYLSLKEAHYLTGQIISPNGGWMT
jgi:3-oxoacyl-[acyl-carrier protein] reductase